MKFDRQHAESYDDRWVKLAPFRDSLHLQMRLVLEELPSDAHILCSGVGTGAELIALAKAFPGWRFAAVDPSAPMLEVCKRRVATEGIADRCDFHAAYVHELPADARFHAATSILVSQFLADRAQRVGFFREIASRLYPGGLLVSADLTTAPRGQHESLLGIWQRMMRYAGANEEQVQGMLAAYAREVGLLPAEEMEALLKEAGFPAAVQFSQSLLIHAWYARRVG